MLTGLTKEQLFEKRGDLSPFLIHLTRSGDLKLDKDIFSLPKDRVVQIDARKSLESIIQKRRIEAVSAFGYFNFLVPWKSPDGRYQKNTSSLVKRDWLRSVCFSETPLDHIHLHMTQKHGGINNYRPFGLAFFENFIRSKNGNPIFYVQTTNQLLRDSFDKLAINPLAVDFKNTMPFIEGFGPPWYPKQYGPKEIDFRWEREWRVSGDLSFTLSDVAFGICESGDIGYFEGLVGNAFPFIDPTSDIQQGKDKLRSHKHLANLK